MSREIHVGKEVINFSNKIKRTIGKEVSKYGITSVQGRILGFIYHQSSKRDIFQKDIEEELEIRRSSVTSVLQLMEKNGYIKRESVSEDARLKKIILTEKGLEVQQMVHSSILKIEASLHEELSDEEIDTLVSLIQRLSKKLLINAIFFQLIVRSLTKGGKL